MAEDKSSDTFSLENLLYVPIGAAAMLRDMVPTIVTMLSARGRAQVEQPSNTANTPVGRATALGLMRGGLGKENLGTRADDFRGAARSGLQVVQGAGRVATTGAVETARDAVATAKNAVSTVSPRGNGGGVAEKLSIPDYDSLSASQVVERLQGLSQDELVAVRGYEDTHRGRKTVLHRLDALLEA